MKKVVLCLLVAVALGGMVFSQPKRPSTRKPSSGTKKGDVVYACGHVKAKDQPNPQSLPMKCPECTARESAAQDFGNGSAPNAFGACGSFSDANQFKGSEYEQCESLYLKTYSNHKSAAEGNYQ